MVSIELLNTDIWKQFHAAGNEMIITKSGRRMFPIVEVAISGLEPKSVYALEMEFVPYVNHRLKYQEGYWMPCGSSDASHTRAIYRHPESPNYGWHFTNYQVSFGKVKMTNKTDCKNMVALNSHYMYYIEIHILKLENAEEGKPVEKLIHSCKFPLTEFIAVTAYQNETVTALKIKYNPFAKAFQTSNRQKSDSEDHSSRNTIVSTYNISSPPANRVVTPNGITPYKQTSGSALVPLAENSSVASCWSMQKSQLFGQLVSNDDEEIPQNIRHLSYPSYDLRWPPSPTSTPRPSCLYPSSHRSPIAIAPSPFTPPTECMQSAAARCAVSPALPCSNINQSHYYQEHIYSEQRLPQQLPASRLQYFSQQYSAHSSSSSNEGLMDDSWYAIDTQMRPCF